MGLFFYDCLGIFEINEYINEKIGMVTFFSFHRNLSFYFGFWDYYYCCCCCVDYFNNDHISFKMLSAGDHISRLKSLGFYLLCVLRFSRERGNGIFVLLMIIRDLISDIG